MSGSSSRPDPLFKKTFWVGDGLTILQTSTIEDARALMQAEPLIQRGLSALVALKLPAAAVREAVVTLAIPAAAMAVILAVQFKDR
jgi:hypothetical protein